ncbi:MAG: metallophosphoesterase [Clostridiaceae bacterium]|nr:metallophosphoesterase [Eubacteriales bacterium]
MKRIKQKRRGLFLLTAALLLLACFLAWQNNALVVTRRVYASGKVPEAFDGFVIAHISDLHSKRFGAGQRNILERLGAEAPDLIVVTGDLVDRRRYDLETAMELIDGAVKLAPVVYVSGNHEAWSGHYGEVREALLSAGVTVLDDAAYTLSREGESITVLGARDPDFLTTAYAQGTDTSGLSDFLSEWENAGGFKLLLSHRPELFELYAGAGMDLVFSGHAHGGQVRLPLLGALYAPDQGLFPRYTSGRYDQNNTAMYVSRGLGNSLFPLRVFNRPELVIVTISREI